MKCINCGYFLNCDEADEKNNECEKGVKANRIIKKGVNEIVLEEKTRK